MRRFDVSEAQERFEELVDAAAAGEVIGITVQGRPAALLVPIDYARGEPDIDGWRDRDY